MAKIKIKQGAGADPSELATAIVGGRAFPFMATIRHKAVKPLVVPSTGLCEAIPSGAAVPFKIKSFDQAWTIVTDSAALAKRYESDHEDFVVIEVANVLQEGQAADEAHDPKKNASKVAAKAAVPASE